MPTLQWLDLGTFSTDAASQLDILGHDGDPLGVDCADVGVLEQANKVCLTRLLECHDGRRLEAKIRLEILGHFPDQPLEWSFPKQQLGGLLIPPDFPQGYGSRPEPVGLLHSSSGRSTLPGSFGSKLLPRGLPTRRLASSLLGSSHDNGQMSSERLLR